MPLQWRNQIWQSLEEGAGKRCSECAFFVDCSHVQGKSATRRHTSSSLCVCVCVCQCVCVCVGARRTASDFVSSLVVVRFSLLLLTNDDDGDVVAAVVCLVAEHVSPSVETRRSG